MLMTSVYVIEKYNAYIYIYIEHTYIYNTETYILILIKR